MNLFEKIENSIVPPAFIETLKVGQHVDWYYKISDCEKKKKKAGGDFLIVTLMDRTGRLPGKVWDNVEAIWKIVQKGVVYRICGEITEYNQKMEIKITAVRALTPLDHEYDENNYKEEASFDIEREYANMLSFLEAHVSTPELNKVIAAFDTLYGTRFKAHYGAQKIHHAYLGGLLQHTYGVIQLAALCAEQYCLDKELLLIGALFHDIGKIEEFSVEPAIETSCVGGLVGHIVLSYQAFNTIIANIEGFPKNSALLIQHMIISHHGIKEFGSPEVPKTPESMVLHLVDMLDSRMAIFRDIKKQNEAGKLFSDFSQTLSTRILLECK